VQAEVGDGLDQVADVAILADVVGSPGKAHFPAPLRGLPQKKGRRAKGVVATSEEG